MKKPIFILFFLVLAAAKGWCAIYYVDRNVTDTNVASATPDSTTYDPTDGSVGDGSASVFVTIADMAKVMHGTTGILGAGDQVLFRRGQDWSSESFLYIGRSDSPTQESDRIVVGAFSADASTAKPSIRNLYCVGGTVDREYFTVQDLQFSMTQFGGNGIEMDDGCSYLILKRLTVFDCDGTTGNGIQTTITTTAPTNVTIENCIIYGNKNRGIFATLGDGSIIQKNRIYTNGSNGISISPRAENDTVTIKDNIIFHNEGYGIATAPTIINTLKVLNNLIYENEAAGFFSHATVAAISQVYWNFIWGNGTGGILLGSDDVASITADIRLNTVLHNLESGISIRGTGPYTVYNNYVEGNGESGDDYFGNARAEGYQYIALSNGQALTSKYNYITDHSTPNRTISRRVGGATTWETWRSLGYDGGSSQDNFLAPGKKSPSAGSNIRCVGCVKGIGF